MFGWFSFEEGFVRGWFSFEEGFEGGFYNSNMAEVSFEDIAGVY